MLGHYSPHSDPAHPRSQWLSLIGPDARDFLHRITTVHARALQPGEGVPGCILNPQGKIRAAFQLWNYAETEFAFEVDPGPDGHNGRELLAAIDQFTFSEKMTLAPVVGLSCIWILGEAAADSEWKPLHTLAIEDEIRICHRGSTEFGRPWITAWGRPERLRQWAERRYPQATLLSAETLEAWRIEATSPRVGFEITAEFNPLEVGFAASIAPNKGCYPGQEIIEKIVALGAPARRLVRLEGMGTPPALGSATQTTATPSVNIGLVTSAGARTPEGADGFQALAVVRKIQAKEQVEIRIGECTARVVHVAPYLANPQT